MRWSKHFAIAALLVAGVAAKSGAARGECESSATGNEPRFEVHGDTVYDKSTHLTWMRCTYGQEWSEGGGGCTGSAKLLDWDSAMALRWRDDAAWRLPQKDELQSIVAPGCKKPAVNETVFPGTPSIQYWTSTASGPSYAWVVFFRTGMATWNFLKPTPFAVRLVRTGR